MVVLETYTKAPPFDDLFESRDPRFVKQLAREDGRVTLEIDKMKVKEAINRAYESSLAEGLLFERREFHSTFGLEDQKEGMRAFVEKRKPEFKNR